MRTARLGVAAVPSGGPADPTIMIEGVQFMPRKPLELPPDVARRFFKDLRAFLAEKNATKADAIAVRQLQVLREYQGPREKKLRLSDVKQMFLQLKDHA